MRGQPVNIRIIEPKDRMWSWGSPLLPLLRTRLSLNIDGEEIPLPSPWTHRSSVHMPASLNTASLCISPGGNFWIAHYFWVFFLFSQTLRIYLFSHFLLGLESVLHFAVQVFVLKSVLSAFLFRIRNPVSQLCRGGNSDPETQYLTLFTQVFQDSESSVPSQSEKKRKVRPVCLLALYPYPHLPHIQISCLYFLSSSKFGRVWTGWLINVAFPLSAPTGP